MLGKAAVPAGKWPHGKQDVPTAPVGDQRGRDSIWGGINQLNKEFLNSKRQNIKIIFYPEDSPLPDQLSHHTETWGSPSSLGNTGTSLPSSCIPAQRDGHELSQKTLSDGSRQRCCNRQWTSVCLGRTYRSNSEATSVVVNTVFRHHR